MEIIEKLDEELTAEDYPVITQVIRNVSNCQALKRLYPDWLEYNRIKARSQYKVTYKQNDETKIIALNGHLFINRIQKIAKKLSMDNVMKIYTTSAEIAREIKFYLDYNYSIPYEYRNNLKIIVKKGN